MVMNYFTRRTAVKTIGAGVIGSIGFGSGVIADNSPQLKLKGHSLLGNPPGGEAEGSVREDIDLAAVGSFLTDNGTYIVDIADPTNPTRIGHAPLPDTRNADVEFHPTKKIVYRSNEPNNANGQGGFEILDVTTPGSPSILNHYDTDVENGVHNVTPYVANGKDYLLLSGTVDSNDDHRGLVIVDVTDPLSPVEEANYQIGSHVVHDVTIRGNLALVAHWNAGLRVLDITDPTNPSEEAAFDYRGTDRKNAHYTRAHSTKDYVVVGDEVATGVAGPKRVITFDTTTGDTDEVAVFSPPEGNAVQPTGLQAFWWTGHNFDFGLGEQSDILFSGDYKAGVQVFDLSDETDPEHIDEYKPTKGIDRVRKEDNGGFIDAVPFTWGANVDDSGLVYVTDFQTAFYVFELVNLGG